MRVLIIGGTGFIGPRVAEQLLSTGHEVSLFHRGQTEAGLLAAVNHIYGDRRDLPSFKSQFRILAPDVRWLQKRFARDSMRAMLRCSASC